MAENLRPLSGLYIISTPIGNMYDISLRALQVLNAVDFVLAEDTRVTRKLLSAYGIRAQVICFHDHKTQADIQMVLDKLGSGKTLALVSDAGTPLINDPGFKLVQQVIDQKFSVTAIPGPSALVNAIVLSGISSEMFTFLGFLPNKRADRKLKLTEVHRYAGSLVFFETGQRIVESLRDVCEILGDREIALAREMTKVHEQVIRGSVREILDQNFITKGEFVVVVSSCALALQGSVSEEDLCVALEKLLDHKPLKVAAKIVAESYGCARSKVYELGLSIKEKKNS